MFGYVSPLKCELLVRDLALYNAYYCGLCRSIKSRFGEIPRLSLSYDCAFLALLTAGVLGAPACEEKRCAYKPLKKKMPIAPDSEALRFAADINILLAYHKCEDDWADEKKASALLAEAALKKAAKKAAAARPEASAAIRHGLMELSKLEKANCSELDLPADAFATLMRGVLSNAPVDEREREIFRHLGWHLGRWIYLIDAWDDREKDAKNNSYNPFNASGAGKERASFLLHVSLNEAGKAYDLLDLKANAGVLDNIMHLGCAHRTEQLLKGERDESL